MSHMSQTSQIARYGRMQAREGKGEELAGLMLAAAAELESGPGCELYLINRQADDPDALWVTELWRSQDDLDASIERITGSDRVAQVRELIADGSMVELEQLGGKGPGTADAADAESPSSSPPYTLLKLTDAEDMAAKFGMSEMGEVRFPNDDLELERTGVSHHRLVANARQGFGHRHERAEEVYVVLSGSGRVKLDEEIVELAELDALRVAPPVIRNFEAGPEGLEMIAFGPRHQGDGEVLPGWWSD